MAKTTCSIDDCSRTVAARGLCHAHDRRRAEYGDPTAGPPIGRYLGMGGRGFTLWQRFIAKVRPTPNGCWEWMGARIPNGYGVIQANGRTEKAHRVGVQLSGRTIPDGDEVDHLCRNRACVNPWHLDVVSPRINVRRMNLALNVGSAKTHCPQGHPYSGDNLDERDGRRYCRECSRQYVRNWHAKQRLLRSA